MPIPQKLSQEICVGTVNDGSQTKKLAALEGSSASLAQHNKQERQLLQASRVVLYFVECRPRGVGVDMHLSRPHVEQTA